jgi:apolipoprotein N-acyltransferase
MPLLKLIDDEHMPILTGLLRTPWALPILSGFFIGTSYIPFPPWASLFGFVPLWLFWSQQSRLKSVFWGGVLCAFVFTLIGFNWVALTLHEFAHLDWPWAIIGVLVYALVANLYVPVAGILWFWGQRHLGWQGRHTLYMMAIITVLCEANSYTLFDWNFGYSWYGADLPVYQWAEVIGFSGLSALTVLANLPLTLAWQQRDKPIGKGIAAGVITVFIVLNCGGAWLKSRLPKPDAVLTTLLVQASINNQEKMSAELGKNYRDSIIQRYTSLTSQALAAHQDTKADFAVWPETAFPFLLGDGFKATPQSQALAEFVRTQQTPLLTGAYSAELPSKLLTNSLFVFDQQGKIVPPHYSKSILLAFGEFIPGENLFPDIRKWLPATGHFARGNGPEQLLQLNGFKIGAQICYESLFPRFSRDLANLGAQFIVNVTNDAWYGTWQEPYQHMYMTLARGVEFRRPVLRATNTGISTVSLASGEILEQSPIGQPWAGMYKVPYRLQPDATFYQEHFWLMPSLLWCSLIALLLWGVLRNKQTPHNPSRN